MELNRKCEIGAKIQSFTKAEIPLHNWENQYKVKKTDVKLKKKHFDKLKLTFLLDFLSIQKINLFPFKLMKKLSISSLDKNPLQN